MPLRLRLAILFGLGAAGVLAVAGIGFFFQLRASLDASLDSTLQARSEALAVRLAQSPVGQPPVGQPPAGSTAAEPDDATQILNVDGTVLAFSHGAGSRPEISVQQIATARTAPVFVTKYLAGERRRLLAAPARSAGTTVVCVVSVRTDITDNAEDHARDVIVVGGPPAVGLAGLGAWLLAGAALRPVERMRRQVADITAHDPAMVLEVPATRDEIAALAKTMNRLLTRLRHAVARERGFVADAGHELRTPLTILKAELELAGRPGRSREELAAAVASAATETDRLVRLTEDLLLLARADEGAAILRMSVFSLGEVLAATAYGAALRHGAGPASVTLDVPEALVVIADSDRIRQVMGNLLDNALHHAPTGTAVEVAAWRSRDVAVRQPAVVIEVRDHGPGFPPGFLPHAFERFRRADVARDRDAGGAGLGLAIVRTLVTAHGGTVTATNRPDGGAVVRVLLPSASSAT